MSDVTAYTCVCIPLFTLVIFLLTLIINNGPKQVSQPILIKLHKISLYLTEFYALITLFAINPLENQPRRQIIF
jgi:hypothetical protein